MAKSAKTRSKASSDRSASQDSKPRAPPVAWDAHREWTWAGIRYLQQNPTFRLKLFSDSVAEAKREGRKKVANGDGKAQLFNELAEVIFKADDVDTKTREEYLADPKRYMKSTQQQFSRYVHSSISFELYFTETLCLT